MGHNQTLQGFIQIIYYLLAVFMVRTLLQNSLLVEDAFSKLLQRSGIELSHPLQKERKLQQYNQQRPKIYTFYTRAPRTGMTESGDNSLLSEWKKQWYQAGWDPQILTIDDATKHHAYEALMELIADKEYLGEYNLMCYVRWIAMSVYGGWMADYDTFPLNSFVQQGHVLPNGGRLTTYDKWIPDLVSGSADEYFRITKLIGESIHKHIYMDKYEKRPRCTWSDMRALRELKLALPDGTGEKADRTAALYDDDVFLIKQDTLQGETALSVKATGNNDGYSREDCEKYAAGKRAIHFSHRSINEGDERITYRGIEYRAVIAREWLNMYHNKCPITIIND